MPKLHHPLVESGCYFLTTVTAGRRPLFRDPTRCRVLIDVIYALRARGSFLLLGFVIMRDHLHLVIALSRAKDASEVMRELKKGSARLINMKSGHVGRVWEEGFWDRVVRDERELVQKLNYVHANPVRARLVDNPAEWPYSSFHPGFETDLEQVMTGIAQGTGRVGGDPPRLGPM